MDPGKESAPIRVEPIEHPVPARREEPAPVNPERTPEKQPEKVPSHA